MASLASQPLRTIQSLRALAQSVKYRPYGTVRCQGTPAFRSQLARDLACLLDLDDEVDAWWCLPVRLGEGTDTHVPDFLVRRGDRHLLIDAGTAGPEEWIEEAAADRGCAYEIWSAETIHDGFRLGNARDLLRYAQWECPLGDRVRLLAGLEENGSMTVGECIGAFQETGPIAGLAALALRRFVSIDIDTAPIGPNTSVWLWTA